MSLISAGSIAKALQPGVNTFYGAAYDRYDAEYKEFMTVKTSDKNFEEMVNVHGFDLAVMKPEGSDISLDFRGQGFKASFRHVVYALGYQISEEAIEDNQYKGMDGITQMALDHTADLAISMNVTKENVAAMILNRAFNNGYTGADGKELASTTHLLSRSSSTFSNALSLDLSESSLEQALINLGDFVDDAGRPIKVRARKLIVPTELEFEAHRILNSTQRVDTALNDINAVRSLASVPEGVRVNHYLTDADAWFLLTDAKNGLICFDRRGRTLVNKTDDRSQTITFMTSDRYSMGWVDPRCVIASQGA